MMDSAVTLLPQPDSPTSPKVRPWRSDSEMPSTARTMPSRVWNQVRRFSRRSSSSTSAIVPRAGWGGLVTKISLPLAGRVGEGVSQLLGTEKGQAVPVELRPSLKPGQRRTLRSSAPDLINLVGMRDQRQADFAGDAVRLQGEVAGLIERLGARPHKCRVQPIRVA